MKLSVIIPIYNTIATLMRCVDSIVLQPVDSMELILVDDGSTDGSGALCDNIKRQYEGEGLEIKVIHKENGGLSSARNVGIAASTGELITFVDADDYLGKNTYSKQMEFFECADDVDVVEFPVAKFYNDFLKKEVVSFTVDFYNTPIDYLYETEAFRHAYAWNKIFRREVLMPSAAGSLGPFPYGKTFEDVAAMPYWLSKARRIVTSDSGMYFYTLNPRGICQTSGKRQYHDHLEALVNLLNWIPKEHRKGVVYAKLFASMLNVRKDYMLADGGSQTPSLPLEATVSWSDILTGVFNGIRKAEVMKLVLYKVTYKHLQAPQPPSPLKGGLISPFRGLGGWSWGVFGALWYVCVFLFIQFATAILCLPLQGAGGLGSALGVVISSVVTIVLFWMLRWWREDLFRIKRLGWRLLTSVAALSLLSLIPSLWLNEILGVEVDESYELLMNGIINSPLGFLVICLLVPVAEEAVFRGALLRKLLETGKKLSIINCKLSISSNWTSILFTALIFGVVHGNVAQFLHATLLGVLLGWLYYKTRSIVPGVLFHIVNNSAAFIAYKFMPEWEDKSLLDIFQGNSSMMYIALLIDALLFIGIIEKLIMKKVFF